MKIPVSLQNYQKYFVDLHFERDGLFNAVQQWRHCTTALYPGCFVHITPSFFFPHVVYVDNVAEAQQFFASEADLMTYISRNKHYRRSAFFRFIRQDFTQPLPLPENSFDLLIALYAGGISQACKPYLKPGGLLLTNNHKDDAGQAARDPDYTLAAVIHEKGEVFTVSETGLETYFVPIKPLRATRSVLRSSGPESRYIKNAAAYLFRKSRQPTD